jgi:hypothetical protein
VVVATSTVVSDGGVEVSAVVTLLKVDAAVVEAASDGTIEEAAPACAGRMMTVRVLVNVKPFWSVTT